MAECNWTGTYKNGDSNTQDSLTFRHDSWGSSESARKELEKKLCPQDEIIDVYKT